MEPQPLISIITSTFQGSKYIEETINSIINQSYSNIEYIIIDGGSTDGTIDIIKKYEKHLKYWVSEPDNGIYDAWNKALKKSSGDWVCFIGDDDYLWDEDVLTKVVPHLNIALKNDMRFVYGKLAQITEETSELIEYLGRPWEESKKRLLFNMTLNHCSSFHHRTLFDLHGYFDPSFAIAGDYEFLLREFKDRDKMAYFIKDLIIAGARNGGVSASLSKRLIMAKETEKARKKNKITKFSKEIFLWNIRIRAFLFLNKIFGANTSTYLADAYRIALGKGRRWTK